MKDLDAHETSPYTSPSSRNFFDRDYRERQNATLDFLPCIAINGKCFRQQQSDSQHPNTNEVFKQICQQLRDRPDTCKNLGISAQKQQIQEQYE